MREYWGLWPGRERAEPQEETVFVVFPYDLIVVSEDNYINASTFFFSLVGAARRKLHNK